MGLLRSTAGRLRLGWRLLAFVALAGCIAAVLGVLLPDGIVGGAAALLAGSVGAGWILLAGDGRGPAALGFHFSPSAIRETLLGLGLGVVIGGTVVALMGVVGGMAWRSQGGSVAGWVSGAVGSLSFLALPAAAEEALVRGYPLQALGEAWGAGTAVAVTGLLFGLLHLANPGAGLLSTVNVAAAGALLGVVYVRTLSLWWATGVHLGWNWSHGYLADVPVSGLDVMDAPLYEGVTSGPAWLGGGAFGPEGSAVATLVLVVAALTLWRAPWLRPSEAARASSPLMRAVPGVG